MPLLHSSRWKPKFCNVGKPFPYLIVDNWYNKFEENAIWKELEFLTSRGRDNSLRAEETIVANVKGKPLGRSYRYYIHDIFNYNNRTASNIVRFLQKQQWTRILYLCNRTKTSKTKKTACRFIKVNEPTASL